MLKTLRGGRPSNSTSTCCARWATSSDPKAICPFVSLCLRAAVDAGCSGPRNPTPSLAKIANPPDGR
eukprot:1068817-Pyramimonas_sp.AAC.1